MRFYCETCDQLYSNARGHDHPKPGPGYACTDCGARLVPYGEEHARTADRIDGYDRDDLGESQDY